MRYLIGFIASLLWSTVWIAGIVLAEGFWSTTFAVCTGGAWSSYLVIERLMVMNGMI